MPSFKNSSVTITLFRFLMLCCFKNEESRMNGWESWDGQSVLRACRTPGKKRWYFSGSPYWGSFKMQHFLNKFGAKKTVCILKVGRQMCKLVNYLIFVLYSISIDFKTFTYNYNPSPNTASKWNLTYRTKWVQTLIS